MSFAVIGDSASLEAVGHAAKGTAWVGVDTEFMRVRTYYPRLCLVQLALPKQSYCIDPLAVDDMQALIQILTDNAILKIFHSARQDIEALHHCLGIVPQPLFDTQMAAAMTGYGDQVGYGPLVQSIVGESLGKALTRTDWGARPLTEAQLRYAVEDVEHLGELYQVLQAKLDELGRGEWLRQDIEELKDPSLYYTTPEQAYRRIGRGRRLEPRAQQRLRALAAWRERTAQRADLPREWVISDTVLVALACDAPIDRAQLMNVGGAEQRWIKKWGEAVLQVIRESQSVEALPLWQKTSPLTLEQGKVCRRLMQTLRDHAEALGVSAGMLGSRRDIERLLRGKRDLPLLRGWRKQVIGDELLRLAESM